jgi:hypothetical protein
MGKTSQKENSTAPAQGAVWLNEANYDLGGISLP